MKDFSSFEKLVGTTIKKYQLAQLIEQNAFGATFLARYPGTEQRYQLRLLTGSEHLSPEERLIYLGQFQQEASKIAALQYPAIHPLLEYGNHDGMLYLISLYISARHSLVAHLQKSGPLDVIRAGYCLDHIASALEHAHLQAILHGHLTPHIIFVIPTSSSQPPSIVVADFGLAHLQKLIKQDGQQVSPTDQQPHPDWEIYAPEQCSGGPIGPASDIYALGAILYQMLTGYSVFEGSHDRNDVYQAPIPSLERWSSHLPRHLDGVIQTAMAKQPEKRYQRPSDLANAYHNIVAPGDVARQPLMASAPVCVQPVSDRQRRNNKVASTGRTAQRPRSVSRRKAIFVIAGVGTAAAVAGIVWASSRSGPNTGSSLPPVAQNATPSSQSVPAPPATSSTGGHTGTVIAHTAEVPVNHAVAFQLAGKGDPAVLIHLPNN
ncbi:MAG TPA: serine/threonine-protein kinase, partial [Ktedonobacteraceae bacterium]|nr:serine/threonine-protein kinase [Ktedonobacteraceae bacterium]